MNDPGDTVALVALADLGITSHVGPGWARAEILTTLAEFGCPAPPDGPAAKLVLDIAAARLDRAIAAALPDGLTLIDSVVCGPPDTDIAALRRQAVTWRDRAGLAEIVARTGLWSPPRPEVMPTVRIEARADDITPDGHRIGELATRADAQYGASTESCPTASSTSRPTSPPRKRPAATRCVGSDPASSCAPTTSSLSHRAPTP